MARSVKERVRDWRIRKAKEGGRSLTAWLEPDTAKMFRFLAEHYGETTSPLIARAIRTLYRVTLEDRGTAITLQSRPPAEKEQEPELKPSVTVDEQPQPKTKQVEEGDLIDIDPLLAEIVEQLAKGVAFQEVKTTLLIRWLRTMKAKGVSFEEMAARLNAAEVPTLTGKGKWEKGMIPAFLMLSST